MLKFILTLFLIVTFTPNLSAQILGQSISQIEDTDFYCNVSSDGTKQIIELISDEDEEDEFEVIDASKIAKKLSRRISRTNKRKRRARSKKQKKKLRSRVRFLKLILNGIEDCQASSIPEDENPVVEQPKTEEPNQENPDTSSPGQSDFKSDCIGDFNVSETESPLSIEVRGVVAVLRGVINSDVVIQIQNLINNNPNVRTLVLTYIPGSEDDDRNLEASLLIHNAKLNTCVPNGGEIASGGVDMFLAGNRRSLAERSFVGVHSWAASDGTEGSQLPREDPQHNPYLNYFDQIGVSQDFYWFTLESAPAAGIHNMTPQERVEWKMEIE